ncbi:Ig-like domain-containing protein [Acinetobacter wuhouensis]|uniref:Ig-like domain-containing protein n=1 Tax=Acinetobacter wuhouensis TaxID=1879050 RepID=UPI001BC86C3A|nr:Ig-like domain-containing protein [Acinetobacter wuhouensis]
MIISGVNGVLDPNDIHVGNGTIVEGSLKKNVDGTWSVQVKPVDPNKDAGITVENQSTAKTETTTSNISTVTFDFDEKLKEGSFTEADIKVTGGTLVPDSLNYDSVTDTWTAEIKVTLGQKVTVEVRDQSYEDLAGNKGVKGDDILETIKITSVKPTEDGKGTEITVKSAKQPDDILVDGVSIQGNGTWQDNGDGTYTFITTESVTGAEITATTTTTPTPNHPSELISDTASLPFVSIDTIAGDDVINKAEWEDLTQGGETITITGKISNPNVYELTVTVNGVSYKYTDSDVIINDDGTWSVTVPKDSIKDTNIITAVAKVGISESNTAESDPIRDLEPPKVVVTLDEKGNITVTFDPDVDRDSIDSTTDIKITGKDGNPVLDKNGNPVTIELKPSEDGLTWTGKVPANVESEIKVEVPAGSYTDKVGNPGELGNSNIGTDGQPDPEGEPVFVDTAPPSVKVEITPEGDIKVTFDPDVDPDTIDPNTDIVITDKDGNPLKDKDGNPVTVPPLTSTDGGITWTGKVPPNVDGEVKVEVPANSYEDKTGNPGTGNDTTVPVDTAPPSVKVEIGTDGKITVTFDPDVDPSTIDPTTDIVITDKDGNPLKDKDGNPVTVPPLTSTDGGITWTGQIPPNVDGEVKVEVPANSYEDLTGNPGTGDDATVPVDTAPPSAPTVSIGRGNDQYVASSELVEGKVTATIKPTEPVKVGDTMTIQVSGESEPRIVKVAEDNIADINTNGVTIQVEKPAEGSSINVTAKVTDAVGNVSDPGNDQAIIDTVADAGKPTIVFDSNGEGTIITTIDPNDITDKNTIIVLDQDGVPMIGLTVEVDSNGKVTIKGNIPDSQTPTHIQVTDKLGNVGKSEIFKSEVKITQYQDNVENAVVDANGNITSNTSNQDIAHNGISNDATPTIKGSAKGASSVEIFIDGKSQGTVTVDSNGNWEFITQTDLSEGDHEFKAQFTDINQSVISSNSYVVTIDTQVKIVEADLIAGTKGPEYVVIDGKVIVIGKVGSLNDSGSKVVVDFNGTKVIGTVDATGQFRIEVAESDVDLTNLPTVTVVDKAGNQTDSIIVEKAVPPMSLVDIVDGDGYLNAGELDKALTIKVTVPVGSDGEPIQAGDVIVVTLASGMEPFDLQDPNFKYENGVWTYRFEVTDASQSTYDIAVKVNSTDVKDGDNLVVESHIEREFDGNTLSSATSNDSSIVDTVGPTVKVTLNDDGTVSFKFSEAVLDFTLDDLNLTNIKLSGLVQDSNDPTLWTATVDERTDPTQQVIVEVKDQSYTDLAENKGSSGSDNSKPPLVENDSYQQIVYGLKAEYWGYKEGTGAGDDGPNLTSLAMVKAFMQSHDSTATFTATQIDYNAVNTAGLGAKGNLATFLGYGNNPDSSTISEKTTYKGTSDAMIKFSGYMNLKPGTYKFKVTADDGYEILLNGKRVVIKDAVQSATTNEFTFTLDESNAGMQELEIFYWDQGGHAVLKIEFDDGSGYKVLGSNNSEQFMNADPLRGDFNQTLVIDSEALLANDPSKGLQVIGVSNADHGTVSFDPVTGKITFIPDTGYYGEATFEYTVSDGKGGRATATVTVNVEKPLVPIVESVSAASANEGTNLVHTVQLSGETTEALKYNFKLGATGDTATADDYGTPSFSNGVTYDATTGKITVPKGVESFTVTYAANTDSIKELTETVTLQVGNVTGVGSINDVEIPSSAAPTIDFEINSYTEISTNGDLNGGREYWGNSFNGSWAINNPGSINNMQGAIGFDADTASATVSQEINTALPENAKILIDLGWNNGWVGENGGSQTSATFSFAGVDILRIETSAEKVKSVESIGGQNVVSEDIMYATVTVMNGVTVTINGITYQSGETFELRSWAKILQDTNYRNDAEYMASRWTSVTVDLPSSLQGQTGTLAVSFAGGQDDIQVGALKVVTESGENSISSSTNVPTKVFSTISISDTDNDIASVQFKLSNSIGNTLTVQKDLLTDKFDVSFENGILTITEKSGVEVTNDDWNSILASTTYFSNNSNANTITVTVTDSENQTASKSVDINGGVSTLTAKSAFAFVENNDVIFDLLNDDNTGGNTLTTVDHFTAADEIDISNLLDNNANFENISEYLTVSYDADADQAVISIDRDGTAGSYQSTELLVLNNQTTDVTLDELLKNNQIII